jgi:uncharacterized membrane protein
VIDYWPLLGIALVVVGFALRFNPLLVVAVAAIATGLLGGMPFMKVLAALGLTTVAGQAQTVRPLVAPMALAAAEKEHGELDEATAERVKEMSAATDNVGLFFGEDIFLAVSSILLIQGALAAFGIQLTPFQLSVWAIPTAICAFLIHGARLMLLDRRLSRSSLSRSDGEGDRSAKLCGGGVGADPSTIESSFDGPPPHEPAARREEFR